MTLNLEMAFILRYFTEFDSSRGALLDLDLSINWQTCNWEYHGNA